MAQIDKIMSIYYGEDKLPYKDIDRQTHYPIASGVNTFVGENDTTKVRFYVDKIGGSLYTWVANVKLPDGSLTYKVLSEVSNDGYVDLELSSLMLSQKGDIYVSLTGYTARDITISQVDGQYRISGNPQKLVSGIVKISVGYAPIVLMGCDITPTEYQLILAKFSDYVEKGNAILVVDSIAELGNLENYQVGQLVYTKASKKVVKINEQHSTSDEIDFNEFVEKTHLGNKIYGTNRYGQETTYDVSSEVIANFIPKRDSNGQIKVPANPTSDNDAVSKAHLEKRINEENGYRLTKNADGDRFDTFAELESATTFYYAGQVRIPTKNDIATVISDENHDGSTTRYFYAGTTYPDGMWTLDEIINERPLTDDQLNALDSGINSTKVAQYDGYETGKQDTIDDLTDIRNNAQAGKSASDSLPNYRTRQAQDLIDNHIYGAINEVREIAEGKTQTFVFNKEALNVSLTKQAVVSGNCEAIYINGADETGAFMDGYYDNWLCANPDFAITGKSISFTNDTKKYLSKIVETGDEKYVVELYTLADEKVFKVGDNIYFEDSDMPDFWVSAVSEEKIDFVAYEGRQNFYTKEESDTRYAQVHEENHFTEKQRFEGGIKINQIEDLDGNLVMPVEQLFDAVGDTLINTTSTSYSGGFLNSNHYIFRQQLTSLTISALESLSATGLKEWKITFNPSSTFALNFPTSGKYQFADGEPIWDSAYEYTLVIEKSSYADDKYNVFVITCEA